MSIWLSDKAMEKRRRIRTAAPIVAQSCNKPLHSITVDVKMRLSGGAKSVEGNVPQLNNCADLKAPMNE